MIRRHLSAAVLIVLLVCAAALSSCEASFSVDKPRVHVLSYGNTYGTRGTRITQYIEIEDMEYKRYAGSTTAGYLNCTANDALDISNAFSALAAKAGYECTTETMLLTVSSAEGGRYEAFKDRLYEISSEMKSSDILVVFFSGHGGSGIYEGLTGLYKNYLVFSDELVDYDLFKADVEAVGDMTKLIIVDACFSGTLLPLEDGVTINEDTSKKDPLKILFRSVIRESASLFIVTASRRDEESYAGKGNSEFTGYFLAAIGGGRGRTALTTIAALKNNRLTLMNTVKYVYDQMAANTTYDNVPLVNGRNDDLVLFQF